MDEEDQDELLQCTDDESLSENEDHCLPSGKPEDEQQQEIVYFSHSKLEFIVTKLILIFSAFVLLIVLPLYLDSVNVIGNAYSLVLTSTIVSSILFIFTLVIFKYFCAKCRNIKIFSCPIKFSKLLQMSIIYIVCGGMIIYSLDRKRVVCHLQDPIKAMVLVFSLLFYFFCCQKFMGLQRIFSATTIIAGLFIAVDYGLCDEFSCRGYERQHVTDDTGIWSWKAHGTWSAIYIIGLALFAAFFTLLEMFVIGTDMNVQSVDAPPTFVSTVSRTVSFPGTSVYTSQLFRSTRSSTAAYLQRRISVIHLNMWIHVIGVVIVVASFWVNFTPIIGKGSNALSSWNFTTTGIICHFVTSEMESRCGNVALFSWIFIISYVVFITTSIRFLILCQSAVYTIATMSSSLALVGIWWSLFYIAPDKSNSLIWLPRVTGELICSLLGVPVVIIGLYFLGKAHFMDYHWSTKTSTQIAANYQAT